MTDDDLRAILHENLRASAARHIFDELMANKALDWEHAVLDYNAKVIQRLARVHIARQRRKAQYWKFGLIRQEEKLRKEEKAKEVGKEHVLPVVCLVIMPGTGTGLDVDVSGVVVLFVHANR